MIRAAILLLAGAALLAACETYCPEGSVCWFDQRALPPQAIDAGMNDAEAILDAGPLEPVLTTVAE